MKDVDRRIYLERISPFIGNPNAKVITGIRRCGKSTIMSTIAEKMDKNVNKIFIDMELWSNKGLRDPDTFYKEISDRIDPERKNCLFVDEVQEINNWESIIRSLIAEKRCDIYLTGSNSRLLNSEYATYLSGRLNTLMMNPLTLRECIDFEKARKGSAETNAVFKRFLEVGGFPILWCDDYRRSDAYSMLTDILSAIMMRDIMSKNDVKVPDVLDRIFMFVCDNVGKYTSVHNIYTYLNANDRSISKDMVYRYVQYLEDAFIIQKANVFDIKGKRILSSKYKYFLADLGLKHSAMGYRSKDISGHIENILYIEMKSRGYDVWVGDSNGKEIDLVAERSGERIYIQATYSLSSENVIKREFGNFNGIKDNHPKYVITMDDSLPRSNQDGIKHCSLKEFLLMEDY